MPLRIGKSFIETASELSVLLGVSKSKTYRIIQSCNKQGKDWRLAKRWGGRREERSLMSLEQEGKLLKEVETEALSGQILIHKDIKGKIELKLGREVSDDYAWDLLKRHHWKKKIPCGSHPKSGEDARADIKKFKELVATKSAEFSNEEDSRAIKLFFQDEARFGRIDNICSCWVSPKGRAIVGNQLIREYTYAYSTVCPEAGESFSLILPCANEDCMDVFMELVSKAFKGYRIIMVMNGASWHRGDKLKKWENIIPLFQPPYSPQVNPIESLWHHIREKGKFKNTTFHSPKEVENRLVEVINNLDKNTLKSITLFKWIKCAI